MSQYLPSLDDQMTFWNGWNREWRAGGLDEFMAAQRGVAVELASAFRASRRRFSKLDMVRAS